METKSESSYSVPARYRRMENLHIVFWIAKDISWCLDWKIPAILMVIPTFIIALVIAYRTRDSKAELAHNLAVALWILANSIWMASEFFHFANTVIWNDFTGKHLSIIPFAAGSIILAYYYFFQRRSENKPVPL